MFLLNLTGSRYEQGYDAGFLTGAMAHDAYSALLAALLGKHDAITGALLEKLADWQWERYLSKQVPEAFVTELQGFQDGAEAAGIKGAGKTLQRGNACMRCACSIL